MLPQELGHDMNKFLLHLIIAYGVGSVTFADLPSENLLQNGSARIAGDKVFRSVAFDGNNIHFVVECDAQKNLRVVAQVHIDTEFSNFARGVVTLSPKNGVKQTFDSRIFNLKDTDLKAVLLDPDGMRSNPKRSIRALKTMLSVPEQNVLINSPELKFIVDEKVTFDPFAIAYIAQRCEVDLLF